MAKLKSVMEKFQQVKQQLQDEKEKKSGGPKTEYDNSMFFRPQAVQGQDRTKFKLRFLPVEESSTGKPWMQINYHMFKRAGDNRYIKVIDPRTFDLNAQNPIADKAKELFNSGNALDQDLARKLYRKPRYFTLVYVKEAPENQKEYEGKVLIYEAGKQVFDKMDAAISDFDICFWDPLKGRDFLLVIKKTGGAEDYANYTDSNFMGADCPISDNEKVMDDIGTQLEALKIKELVVKKEGVKSGPELKALMEGGVKSAEIKMSPAKDVTENKTISVTNDDVDFGDIGNAPKQTEKATPKAAEAKASAPKAETKTVEAKKDDVETDVDFNEDDFKFD